MAVTSLPWLFHVHHIAAGQSANYTLGNGALDSLLRIDVRTLNSIRRIALDSAPDESRVVVGVPSGTRFVAGFLYRLGSTGTQSGDRVIALQNGGSDDFYLGLSGGRLTVHGGGSMLEDTGVQIGDSIDRYIEVAVHLDDAGSYEVRVDGVTVASASGVDTTSAGSADGLRFRIASGVSAHPAHYANLYLKEWEDANTPGFYGPLVFHHIEPTADVSTEWDPDTGAENFSRLNEAAIDDDTSYVETDVDAEVDEYTAEDAPNDLASVVGVVRYAVATAPAGGVPAVELGVKDGVDEAYGAALTLSGSYRTHQSVFDEHPSGSAWSESNFDSTSLLLRSSLP